MLNRIDDIMVTVFVLNVVDRRLYSRSGLVSEWLLFNFQLHHGENKLHFDKMMINADDVQCWWCTMLMMYNADDVQCWWWSMLMMYNVDDVQCWWCTMLMMSSLSDFNSTSSLKQQSAGRHVAPLIRHIILIPRHSIATLISYCCVFYGEAANANFIVIGFTRMGFEHTIYHTRGEHAISIKPVMRLSVRSN